MKALCRMALGVVVCAGASLTLVGCSGETKMAEGDPKAVIAPASTEKKSVKQGGPPTGSSAGMNFNPGGNN